MMGFKIVIFALLVISLQQAVGDSSNDVRKIETAEHSHHHHVHRRGLFLRYFKSLKEKDNSKTQFSSNMKWEKYQENQKNVVFVSIKDQDYLISRDNHCKPEFSNISNNNLFLVNPDNIENLEWKPVKHRVFLQVFKVIIPPFTVETCDGNIIARNNQGLGYITAKSKQIIITNYITKENEKPETLEVLTINFDNVTEEYLTNVQFDSNSAQRNKKPSIIKNLTVVNNNCKEMKQAVKINNDNEETASFQTGNTLLIGGSLGIDNTHIKVEATGTEGESNSDVKRTGYEYTQELDIPPHSSCNLVIDCTAFVTTVPFTADLTRVYKNGNVNTASVNGTYTYQESSEIKTNFETCTELSDHKCKI